MTVVLSAPHFSFAQSEPDTIPNTNNNAVKTVNNEKSSLDVPVYYNAKDSIRSEIKNKLTYLYGDAEIKYDDVTLKADYMVVDMDKNEVTATYTLDSLGNPVGKPFFTQGNEEMTCDSIRYNFDTKRGLIYEVRTQQGEGYIHMSKSKRQANEYIHLKGGKYTTCNLEDPHFHFELSKAIIVPEKRIVTGPMNLWLQGVPTPLGLPFGYFPNSEEKKKGLLFPTYGQNFYGIFLQDLGYYLPINDNMDASFYGTIYTRGSWGLRANTNYRKIYKVDGAFDIGFQRFKEPFPDENKSGKLILKWNHRQDPKAHPSWKFNSSVNFQSDNNAQNNLDAINNQFLNNSIQSDINVSKIFPGKPFSFNAKLGLKQNGSSKSIDAVLPDMSFNVNRFYLPLKFLEKNRLKWIDFEKIGVTYNLNARNTASFADTLLQQENLEFLQDELIDKMRNGLSHNANIQTSIKLFKSKALVLNPSVRYNEYWNFQTVEKNFNTQTQEQEEIINQGFAAARDLSLNANLTTKFFGYYQFIGKKQPKLRHVMTPTVSYTHRPDLGQSITSFAGPNGELIEYSPFEVSQFRQGVTRESGVIGINILNNFELKYLTPKDTANEFKKIKILEVFSLNTGYDLYKDTNNWSDINMRARTSPAEFMSLNSSLNYGIYGWDEAGRELSSFAVQNNGKLGRIKSADLALDFRFTSKKGRERQKNMDKQYGEEWGAELAYLRMHPELFIDFKVPWNLNVNYKITYNQRTINRVEPGLEEPVAVDSFTLVQTLGFSGDLNITEKWKIAFRSGFDIKSKEFSYTTVDIFRDLHCWQMHFYWVPFGANKSYNLQINVKASMLQDLKYVRRRPNWDY